MSTRWHEWPPVQAVTPPVMQRQLSSCCVRQFCTSVSGRPLTLKQGVETVQGVESVQGVETV